MHATSFTPSKTTLHPMAHSSRSPRNLALPSPGTPAGEQCDACGQSCLDLGLDAEYLPCEHVVCTLCFEEAVTRESSTGCSLCDGYSSNSFYSLSSSSHLTQGLETEEPFHPESRPYLRDSRDYPIECDLCTDSASATSRCENCGCFLCSFCEEAHRRQRRTIDHQIVSLSDTVPSSLDPVHYKCFPSPIPCCTHETAELRFFCETCTVRICHQCKQLEHEDHQIVTFDDIDVHCSEKLWNLLTKTQPLVSTLNESTQTIQHLLNGIEDQSLAVADQICKAIDSHIAALQQRKMILLSKLDNIRSHKTEVLSNQLASLSHALKNIRNTCDAVSQILTPENDVSSSISTQLSLAKHLEELTSKRYEYRPLEDDYIRFLPHISAGQLSGYEMFGVLDSQAPSPSHSVLNGEGLHSARQRTKASITLTVFNKNGEPRLVGGDKVELRVHTHTGPPVRTEVVDNDNGSYDLFYSPEQQGDHRVSVLLQKKHVKGSPFIILVRPRGKKHRGIFHCCTFCSSGGKKHVRCGCGGMMPGGYSGCGHGHMGHPGCKHWSCCGSTEEKSECHL